MFRLAFVSLLILILNLPVVSIQAQHLFSNAISQGDSASIQKKIHGFVRAAIYTPVKDEKINGLYTQAAWQFNIQQKKLAIETDLRFTTGQFYNEKSHDLHLRTCFIRYTTQKWTFDLGRQLVSWGTGDGFNPTNNFSATDFFSLTEEPSERQQANYIIEGTYHPITSISIEGIFQPIYQSSTYRYELINTEEMVTFQETKNPTLSFSNGSYGIKIQGHHPSISWSVSAFQGYDPMPWLTIHQLNFTSGSAPLIEYSPTPFKKTTLGTDFEFALSRFIIRGELGYDRIDPSEHEDMFPDDKISSVFNLEGKVGELHFILQYICNHTLKGISMDEPLFPEIPDPDKLSAYQKQLIDWQTLQLNRQIFFQQQAWNHAVNLHLMHDLNYNTIRLELAGYYAISTKEWMIAPKIRWSMTENLKLTGGYNHYSGPADSLFERISPFLSNCFIELSARF